MVCVGWEVGAGEAQENVGERVRVRCRCFGNFACFGGIVQRLVLGAVWLMLGLCACCQGCVVAARAVWLLLPVLCWLLSVLCGCFC